MEALNSKLTCSMLQHFLEVIQCPISSEEHGMDLRKKSPNRYIQGSQHTGETNKSFSRDLNSESLSAEVVIFFFPLKQAAVTD